MREFLPQQKGDLRAIEGGCPFARVEVENDAGWLLDIFGAMQEGMELNGRNAGAPDKGSHVVDQEVMDFS